MQTPIAENDEGSVEEQTDAQLEEELKSYRQEREDMIQEANGLVEGGSPDEDNYSFDLSGSFYTGRFDTREITDAYAAARIYVTDTLGLICVLIRECWQFMMKRIKVLQRGMTAVIFLSANTAMEMVCGSILSLYVTVRAAHGA